MPSSVKWEGRWNAILAFLDHTEYRPVIGQIPHVRTDHSTDPPQLIVLCSDGQLKKVQVDQYLVLEDEDNDSRFNVSDKPVGDVWEWQP